MMRLISSARISMFVSSSFWRAATGPPPGERSSPGPPTLALLSPSSLQLCAHATERGVATSVEQDAADLRDDPTDEIGVDAGLQHDLLAGRTLERVLDAGHRVGRQRRGGCQLGLQAAGGLVGHAHVGARDLGQTADAIALDDVPE